MKKIICAFLLLISYAGYGQDHNEIIERFLEQRKNMMEEIMKAFDDDDFFSSDFFSDENLFDSFKFKGFKSQGENVKVDEVMEKDGTISIYITPLNKEIKLDIQTTENQIKISGENLIDEKIENKTGVQKKYFKSKFSRMIAIPQGYTAQSPVKVDEKIKIALVPSDKNPLIPDKNGRIPVPKQEGEETI